YPPLFRSVPAPRLVVVLHRVDGRVEADVLAHAILVGGALHVGPDLRLRREHARPAGVELEREGVHVRGHVAGAAGVGVVVPRAAERLALLQHDEVVESVLLEPDRHAEAGETGADDDDRRCALAHNTSSRVTLLPVSYRE